MGRVPRSAEFRRGIGAERGLGLRTRLVVCSGFPAPWNPIPRERVRRAMSLSPDETPRTPDAYEQFWAVEDAATSVTPPTSPTEPGTPPDAYDEFHAVIEG